MGCGRKIGPYDCCSVICGDALELIKPLPTGCVDAVVTDPPYGIFACGGTWGKKSELQWDREPAKGIQQVIRLGKDSAVWGGNYFQLPTSRGWLVWYKRDSVPSAADVELAWTSLDTNAKLIDQTIAATNAERCGHPTQKPLRVMLWTLGFFPDAHTILDPYCGSGTTLVAATMLGCHFLGFEISEDYCHIARDRIARVEAQQRLYEAKPEQLSLAPISEEML